MNFIEVFAPKGTFTEAQRDTIGARFVGDLLDAGAEAGAPSEVMEAARATYQVAFHDSDAWYVGGQRNEGGPARCVVRVTVPEAWREEMSEHLIQAYTKILAETLDDQGFYEEPRAWIQVVGVPEGGSGAFGKVMRGKDVLKLITQPYREAPRTDVELAPGHGLDPVCGMTVPFQHAAGVAEHEGTTYAFCSKGCHEVFTEEHAA